MHLATAIVLLVLSLISLAGSLMQKSVISCVIFLGFTAFAIVAICVG